MVLKNYSQKDIINKILSSNYLKDVYFYVLDKKYFQQKDVLIDLKGKSTLKYSAHLSTTIKNLKELGIIECVNPENFNHKRYKITQIAEKIKEEVEKYGKSK